MKTQVEIRKEFEKEWWKDFFPQCKECIEKCKQSWKILEIKCKKFKKADIKK